jgi:hypothetical protein
VTPWLTPAKDFYRIDTALSVPEIKAEEWELRVHGLVEEEVRLTFQDLLDADLIESHVTLTCVSNPVGGNLAGNAKWLGLPIREVLKRARPTAGADMVLSTSIDGFSASTPLEVLQDDRDAMLAIGMNGEPLPLEHGYPVRMVVPGLYGFVSATKWVVDLEVTRFADSKAYWTQRGWSERGPIKTMARVEVPKSFAVVKAGKVAIGGTAWAQTRGITKVEVQIDGGDWAEAVLSEEASVDTWRQWSFEWDATPGPHYIKVRATDGTGEVQTEQRADPVPDGASGWQSVMVTWSSRASVMLAPRLADPHNFARHVHCGFRRRTRRGRTKRIRGVPPHRGGRGARRGRPRCHPTWRHQHPHPGPVHAQAPAGAGGHAVRGSPARRPGGPRLRQPHRIAGPHGRRRRHAQGRGRQGGPAAVPGRLAAGRDGTDLADPV